MEKLIKFFSDIINRKYTGDIEINFNQGGVRGIKLVKREQVKLKPPTLAGKIRILLILQLMRHARKEEQIGSADPAGNKPG